MSIASRFEQTQPRFRVLRFMATLKAARDFGLDSAVVEAVALRFDPLRGETDELTDALAAALIEQGTLELPDAL